MTDTIEEPEFDVLGGDGEMQFDRYGRYLIPDIETPDGAPKSRMRSTTFAKRVADTFTLNQWGKRLGGYGLMMDAYNRGTMIRRMRRLDLDRDKKELDAIMEEAFILAGGKAGADTGTRYHTLTEWVDGDSTDEPEMTNVERADMLAYKQLFVDHRITIMSEHIERTVLVPAFNVAGTYDRIVMYRGEPTILDLKTGNIDYAEAEICIQLWLYAQARAIWDWKTRTFFPFPRVRQDYGLVVHLRPGSQKPELVRAPFSRGKKGAAVSIAVANYRSSTDGLTKVPHPNSNKLIDKVFYAETREALQQIWNQATPAQRNQVRFPAAVKAKLATMPKEIQS